MQLFKEIALAVVVGFVAALITLYVAPENQPLILFDGIVAGVVVFVLAYSFDPQRKVRPTPPLNFPGTYEGRIDAMRRALKEQPVRIRLADPPDDTTESDLDWAHISVTNDTEDNLPVTVSGSWGEKSVDFEWEPNGGYAFTVAPKRKARFAFVARLRAGGRTFRYRGIEFTPGICYVCDPKFHLSGKPGETLPSSARTQIRVEAHATGYTTVARRFDVYVPGDPRKAMWVVPRGDSGND